MDGQRTDEVELFLFRHGQTPGNAERRYVGSADDQPLSELGREQARAARSFPDVDLVYVSTLRRTHETAAIMFPNARQVVVEGIQEMDFGAFTGRSADEMADDEEYRAWVDGWCLGPCPGGESKADLDQRVCAAMRDLLMAAAARGERVVHMVGHGGTMMAFLDHYAHDDERNYYEWNVGNCQGYRILVRVLDDDVEVVSVHLL